MKRKFLILILAILSVFACAFGLTACNNTDGTYYKLNANGEPDRKTYFVLKSGKWEDEDGASGTYKKDGEKITFYTTFFGETVELTSGTLNDNVLKVNNNTYISEKHKHAYGEWEIKAATCTAQGYETRSCSCGIKETNYEEKLLHKLGEWESDNSAHWKVCGTCKNKLEYDVHDNINNCTVCGYSVTYTLNSNKNGYILASINKNISKFSIPSTYNNVPVTSIGEYAFLDCWSLISITIPNSVASIGDGAFYSCIEIKSITIPDSVTSIGDGAFLDCWSLISITIPDSVTEIGGQAFRFCRSLTSIKFEGTKAQWNAITKDSGWDNKTGDYTITCTDGTISK